MWALHIWVPELDDIEMRTQPACAGYVVSAGITPLCFKPLGYVVSFVTAA